MGMVRSLMAAMHAPIYEARLRELVRRITPHLSSGDRILDVGCGSGQLGRALSEAAGARKLIVEGLERAPRGGELIPVREYSGGRFPFDDASYDVVIVADVLHHAERPRDLFTECLRVSRRLVVVKDHQLSGPFAQPRIALLDWAANAPYGVPCTFHYNTLEQWREWIRDCGASVVEEQTSLNLYPPIVNAIFGRRLHYFVVLAKQAEPAAGVQRGRPSVE